jgi:hypothetical protein
MDTNTWFIGRQESKDTVYSFIQTSRILRQFPNYRRLFLELKVPDECCMVGRIDSLMQAMNKMFSFEVEYVDPGALVDLNAHNKDMYMYRYYHGHIYPSVKDGSNILKIESVDNKRRYVDIPKALYEYGQMINHQVMSKEVESGNHFHNTSAHYASLLMGYDETQGETEENVWALAFGKQLSGWVNAMWLTWLLGIDQHALIMAMVLLEIDEMEDDEPPEFAQYIWLKYKDYVLDREFADAHFKHTGPYSLDDFSNGCKLDETAICQQIDNASALLFQIMILDENFRQAEEQYRFNHHGSKH